MVEPEFKGRAIIKKDIDILEIKIPAKKRIFNILFTSVWLIAWAIGEVFALFLIFNINEMGFTNNSIGSFMSVWISFMSVLIIAWTISGAFVIFFWSWMLIGYELIIIEKGVFIFQKKIGLINFKKEYEIKNIKCITVSKDTSEHIFSFRNEIGKIKFDYGMETIKFANDLDEAEAKMIICELQKNHNFTESNFA